MNSAATMFMSTRQLDDRGNELSFATSHLGHFQLTQELLPSLLAAPNARVLNVTSGAARFGQIRWQDLAFDQHYDAGAAHSQAKLANVLFTVELDRRYRADGLRAFAAHPGVVIGPGPHPTRVLDSYRAQGLVDDRGATLVDPASGRKTIEQGAATIVFGAVSPLLGGLGGLYLKDSDVAVLNNDTPSLTARNIPSDANSSMLDPDQAQRLWVISDKLIA